VGPPFVCRSSCAGEVLKRNSRLLSETNNHEPPCDFAPAASLFRFSFGDTQVPIYSGCVSPKPNSATASRRGRASQSSAVVQFK
jgi:hypothetical protein